jgi:hypothetical protein
MEFTLWGKSKLGTHENYFDLESNDKYQFVQDVDFIVYVAM